MEKRGRPQRQSPGPTKTSVRRPLDLGYREAIRVDPGTRIGRYTVAEVALLAKYRTEPPADQLRDLVRVFAVECVDTHAPDQEVLAAAARILGMVHAALIAGDHKTLKKWESTVYGYANDLVTLPPRAGKMRADAVRKLIAAAKENIATGRAARAIEEIGWNMANAVEAYFPGLDKRMIGHAEKAARVADAWQAVDSVRRRDPEGLALEALVAFGVRRAQAANWIKGADISVRRRKSDR